MTLYNAMLTHIHSLQLADIFGTGMSWRNHIVQGTSNAAPVAPRENRKARPLSTMNAT